MPSTGAILVDSRRLPGVLFARSVLRSIVVVDGCAVVLSDGMAVDGGVWRVATFARLLVLCTLALALDAAGKPLSIPPSQFW